MKKHKIKSRKKYHKEFMTPQDLAHYLGFTRRTIYEKVLKREIPAIRIFGNWRFRKSDIDKWIKSHSNMKNKRKSKWTKKA